MSVYSGPEIENTGLVLCLDAANIKSYPGSGSTWFDLSGKGNHGALTGSPLLNGTTNFTGTEYATVTFDSADFTFDFEQTIILALRPNENDATRRNPYNQAYGGGGTLTHETGGGFNYYYGTSGLNASPYVGVGTTFTVLQNEWAIVSISRSISGNYVRLYKNNVLYNEYIPSYAQITTGTQNILIGSGYAGGYIGNIDYVALYNRALTTLEIQKNFNALRGRFGI